MNHAEIMEKLKRLSKATKNQPSADDLDLMAECIADNRLTEDEINRGYAATRDSPEPWWPKPGEFLARARPAGLSKITGEAETIFQNLIDHPDRYGKYNPNVGIILERRLVEARHGEAAGRAFAAVSSRFRGLLQESVPFVRKDFLEAYDDARRDLGAPKTLELPAYTASDEQRKAKASLYGVKL